MRSQESESWCLGEVSFPVGPFACSQPATCSGAESMPVGPYGQPLVVRKTFLDIAEAPAELTRRRNSTPAGLQWFADHGALSEEPLDEVRRRAFTSSGMEDAADTPSFLQTIHSRRCRTADDEDGASSGASTCAPSPDCQEPLDEVSRPGSPSSSLAGPAESPSLLEAIGRSGCCAA